MNEYDERIYILEGVSDATLQELIEALLHSSLRPSITNKNDFEQLVDDGVVTRSSRFESSFLISLKKAVYSENGIISNGGSDEDALEFWESSTELMRYAMVKCVLVDRKVVFNNPIYLRTGSAGDANLVRTIERARGKGVISTPTIVRAYYRGLNEEFPTDEPSPEYLAMSSFLIDLVLCKISAPDS